MSKKKLKKEIKVRLEYCDIGKIVDFDIYDSTMEKGKFVYCNIITFKNHVVTKYYFTYDIENNHLELAEVKDFY